MGPDRTRAGALRRRTLPQRGRDGQGLMGQLRTFIVVFAAGLAALASLASAMPGVRLTTDNPVPSCVTADRLMAFLQTRNPRHDPRFENIAAQYEALGRQLAIRWDFAFFHMLLETGDLSFRRSATEPGPVAPEQNNFADIGVAGDGYAGESFPDIRTGVQAHIEHLLVYAGVVIVEPVAERTEKVQAWRILNSWHASLDREITFSDLARRWAMGNDNYVRALSDIARSFYDRHCPESAEGATLLVMAPRIVAPETLASADDRTTAGQGRQARAIADGWQSRGPQSSNTVMAALAPLAELQIKAKPTPAGLGAGKPRLANPVAVPQRRPSRAAPDSGRTKVAALTPETREPARAPARPTIPGKAETAAPEQASIAAGETPQQRLQRLLSGRKVHLTTSLGATIPMHFRADGSLSGHANGYAFYLGSQTDTGKWWIESDKICTKWSRWLDRDTMCIRITGKRGERYFWRSDEGKTGSAQIAGG